MRQVSQCVPFAFEGLVDEVAEARAVDARSHVAEGGQIRTREAMAQIEVSRRRPPPTDPTPAPQGNDLRRPSCRSVMSWCMLEKPLLSAAQRRPPIVLAQTLEGRDAPR